MTSAFEGATKAAIAELIQTHSQESKFGYIITRESYEELVGAIYGLLVTSRNLKSAGDRFLGTPPQAPVQTAQMRSKTPTTRR